MVEADAKVLYDHLKAGNTAVNFILKMGTKTMESGISIISNLGRPTGQIEHPIWTRQRGVSAFVQKEYSPDENMSVYVLSAKNYCKHEFGNSLCTVEVHYMITLAFRTLSLPLSRRVNTDHVALSCSILQVARYEY